MIIPKMNMNNQIKHQPKKYQTIILKQNNHVFKNRKSNMKRNGKLSILLKNNLKNKKMNMKV